MPKKHRRHNPPVPPEDQSSTDPETGFLTVIEKPSEGSDSTQLAGQLRDEIRQSAIEQMEEDVDQTGQPENQGDAQEPERETLIADVRRSLVDAGVEPEEEKLGLFQRLNGWLKKLSKKPSRLKSRKPVKRKPIASAIPPLEEDLSARLSILPELGKAETLPPMAEQEISTSLRPIDQVIEEGKEGEPVRGIPEPGPLLRLLRKLISSRKPLTDEERRELEPTEEKWQSGMARLEGVLQETKVSPKPEAAAGSSEMHEAGVKVEAVAEVPDQGHLERSLRQLRAARRHDLDEDYKEIREVALQDFVEAPEEPEEKKSISLFGGLRPFEKRVLGGMAALVLVIILFTGAYFLLWSPKVGASTTQTPRADLPYPTQITLPGGWVFTLSRGAVEKGDWVPDGPEWLEGTEISRWVSLPWSLQLEAVVRTLKAGDPIEVLMSNMDQLVYKVESIQNVDRHQLEDVEKKTPSLLLILTDPSSDMRWVVIAAP